MNKLLRSLIGDEKAEGIESTETIRLKQEKISQLEADQNSKTELFPDTSQSETAVQDVAFDSLQVHDLAKNSLDFLAALAAPLVFKFYFPSVFLSVWLWLLSFVNKIRSFPQLALGLPRGFGKTTVIKLFVLYCILFTNKKFILVISNTAKLAEHIIGDIAAFLDEPNIKKIFGDWRVGMTQDTLSMKQFGFRGRNIVLTGIGAGTSLRGMNINNTRPDIMIFEDIQSREDADSETISKALETWMYGTAMKAKSPEGCMFLFVANMYPTKHSILRKLKSNPNWVKFIAGGILADGTSLWEDLQPIEQLTKEFENDLAAGHPEIFYSEVLNDENAAANNLLDFSRIPDCDIPLGTLPEGNFIIIDPSGMKKKSDECAIGYLEIHNVKPVLMELTSDRLSPGDTIRVALQYALQHNCRLVAIESVAYQSSLCYWFNVICTQMQITGIECVEIYPGGFSKTSRILSMFKDYQKGEVQVTQRLRAQVHGQMVGFNPLKTDNTDDILDLLCYAPKVIENFAEFIVASNELISQELDNIPVLEYTSSF